MVRIDRNSLEDARKHVDLLLSQHGTQEQIAEFVAKKIAYANALDASNWNLNWDLYGKYLRFNVGQEYCIQITYTEILILCLRQDLSDSAINARDELVFRGYDKQTGVIDSPKYNEVPDCLAKVPSSIGVVIKANAKHWLPSLEDSNRRFIEYAISNTRILPQMVGAHSVGAVDFLASVAKRSIVNPSFAENAIWKNEACISKTLQKLSDQELEFRLQSERENSEARKTLSNTCLYVRNPYVAERARRLAAGTCQDCGHDAPFMNRLTKQPYLEVHHILPLSEGGDDSIDNVVALCPNCHRKRHYG